MQPLPGGEQPPAKIRVFVAQLATRPWSQIESKATTVFNSFRKAMFVPKGGWSSSTGAAPKSNSARMPPMLLGPSSGNHGGGEKFFPEYVPSRACPRIASRAAVKLRSQSSLRSRRHQHKLILPCASRIPAFRACDFPGLDSNEYRNRPGCRRL